MVLMERQDEGADRAPEARAEAPAAAEDELPGDGNELRIRFGDWEIDYAKPFARVTYAELFRDAMGFPMSDTQGAIKEAERRGFRVTGPGGTPLADILIINELFEEV